MFDTPILLMVFNRPGTTQKVFEQVRAVKPAKLFIAADGPRKNNTADISNCGVVRDLILNNVDWNCEIKTLMRDTNLGCKKSVSSAITWFFDNVEHGIILEDDTVPNNSFFSYTANALTKYDKMQRVMHIAGVNFEAVKNHNISKNYFSKYPQVWGWATWKRAWKNYDVSMADWPDFKNSAQFKNWCLHKTEQKYWTKIFDAVYNNTIDTWDYQWVYTMIKNNGISLVPAKNMVTNIGFNAEATHTNIYDADFAELPAHEYNGSGDKIPKLNADKKADVWMFNNVYNRAKESNTQTSLIKIRNSIKNFSKSLGV